MTIERTDGEIVIRISNNIEPLVIQQIIDFLAYKETTKSSVASQEEVDRLSSEININWWERNKSRLLNQ
jgi:hypothetical protein